MTHETHRCSVDGCPSLAAYRVMLYHFDPAEGAVSFAEDESCPYLCREHALENEEEARGERSLYGRVAYPHTSRGGDRGISLYLDLPGLDAA